MTMNAVSSFGLMAFLNMISDGRLRVVTAIIKLSTVPSSAPLDRSASATGIVPKISAYIGTPTSVARITPKGFLFPRTVSTTCCGIQLWITAPMPTPRRIYGKTLRNVDAT